MTPGTTSRAAQRRPPLPEGGPRTWEPPARVTLVHDYLLTLRGAERTFAAMADCWPAASISTLLYDERATRGRFAGRRIHTSPLQHTGMRQRGFRALLPLFPWAVEHLYLEPAEIVLSSSSAFAHGVRPDPAAIHVCYCHSPFRYVWHERDRALAEAPVAVRPALRRQLRRIRHWDLAASCRVTQYIANSRLTRERIAAYWHRDATVVHPPVDVDRFRIGDAEDFFLVVGELVPHKRVDVALEAARRARRPIKVVGEGPDRPRLEGRYGGTAQFLGSVDDEQLVALYARARALVVANVEEFGIAAVEAQASGRPVVAVDAGGVRETVQDGETGVLVPGGTVDALAEALACVDFDKFDPRAIARRARRFSPESFQAQLRRELDRARSAVRT
jgi:glycosyltransferase involved in cell wall biosynthesis